MPLPLRSPRNPDRAMQLEQLLEQATGKTRMQRLDEHFPIKAYRGLRNPVGKDNSKRRYTWFSSDPETANTYNRDVLTANIAGVDAQGQVANSLPGRLGWRGKTGEIDAQGESWDSIPMDRLPPDMKDWMLKHGATPNAVLNTEYVHMLGQELGYDIIAIKNVRDSVEGLGKPATTYIVLNETLVRAPGAQANPRRLHSNNLLASLGLAGAGLGAAASLPDEEE